MSNGQSLKRPFLNSETPFDYSPSYKALQHGTSQKVFNCDFVIHEPLTEITDELDSNQIEFEFKDTEDVWAFGPNTRFQIEGQFQCMTPAKDANPEIPWAAVTAAELDKVIVAPNFLDMLITKFEMTHRNDIINYANEDKRIAPFLNAWKYNYMSRSQKKLLCFQDANPGLGVPSKIGAWTFDENSEWRKQYGPKIFVGDKTISFDWVPLDVFPFFQGCNYLETLPKVVPMPILERILLRIMFIDNFDLIFKKKTGNDKKYRFVFKKFHLIAEHLRLNPTFKNTFLKQKAELEYPGVTRLQKSFNIPEKASFYKAKIPRVPFPEGVFIFTVPKNVITGNYNYSDNKNGNVFEKHNIKQIDMHYGEQPFFMNSLNIGMINSDIMEKKFLNDCFYAPAFGMKMDTTKINPNNSQNGGVNTPYPHVYMNFCNSADKTRLVPLLNNGSIFEKDHSLDLTIMFDDNGAAPDVIYVIYLFYTDTNIILDTKNTPIFKSSYLKFM